MAPFGGKRGKNPYRDKNGRFSGPGGSAARGAAIQAGLKGKTAATRTRGGGYVAQQATRRGGDAELARAIWENDNAASPFPTAGGDYRSGSALTGTGYRKKK